MLGSAAPTLQKVSLFPVPGEAPPRATTVHSQLRDLYFQMGPEGSQVRLVQVTQGMGRLHPDILNKSWLHLNKPSPGEHCYKQQTGTGWLQMPSGWLSWGEWGPHTVLPRRAQEKPPGTHCGTCSHHVHPLLCVPLPNSQSITPKDLRVLT